MNVNDQDIFMPIEEATQLFKCEKYVIPYVPEIKQQTMSGEFWGKVSDKDFNKSMRKIMLTTTGG